MNKTRTFFLVGSLALFSLASCHKKHVEPPVIEVPEFSNLYGGSLDDFGLRTIKVDGGYLTVGFTASTDSGIVNHGGSDILVISTDDHGKQKWIKAYGGSALEFNPWVASTPDGGYLICSMSDSDDGDVTANHGSFDVWILKIDANGGKLWSKNYGGSGDDIPNGITVNADGSFAVAFQTASTNGDVSGNHGGTDAAILVCDASGNKIFTKCYGGSDYDAVGKIAAVSGGYIISGETGSSDGDITENKGEDDLFLLKVDGNGNKAWMKTYGSSDDEINASGLVVNQDGSIAVAATTTGNDGDISGNHGYEEIWFLKVDASGNKLVSKCFGGSDFDDPFDLCKTSTGYVVVGETGSTDGDVSGNHGSSDAFVLKLDNQGNKQSLTCYGGEDYEDFRNVFPLGNSLVLTGWTNSVDGEFSEQENGNSDFWLKTMPW